MAGLLALAVATLAQQGTAEIRGANGVIRLTGFSSFSVRAGGETVAVANGPSVKLEDTGNGLTLTGKTMSVVLRRNGTGLSEVVSAEVDGGAEAFWDTGAATLSRRRPTTETTRAHIVSEKLRYAATEGEGALVIPQKLAYDSVTEGKGTRKSKDGQTLPTTFTETIKLTGSSARFTVGIPANSNEDPRPRTGRVEGPVKFDLLRNESAADGTTTNHVNGRTDLFTADFVSQPDPVLTATGHVDVNGDSGDFIGNVTGSQAVITLDRATLQPKLYEFTGQPTVTTVKKLGGEP